MSDFNIRKFLAEQEQLAESSTEHDVEHSDQMDDEDYDVPAMESEIISGYDPRLIAQDMIDGGMTATSDANFDDLYAHYMGRNGDPATQYDYELKEAVRAAYKAILKNKVQSGSDFNELPESGGDQYDDMEWGNTDSGEVRPPTDEEYDRAKDQLSWC
jgi:hypothetical protein